MFLKLAPVVLSGACIVLFSDEFSRLFKRVLAIKTALLFLPLFVISWFIYTFNVFFLDVILYLRDLMRGVWNILVGIIPFQQGAHSIASIVLLTVFSVAPVFIMDTVSRKNTYYGYKYPYITSSIIWILSTFLLILI